MKILPFKTDDSTASTMVVQTINRWLHLLNIALVSWKCLENDDKSHWNRIENDDKTGPATISWRYWGVRHAVAVRFYDWFTMGFNGLLWLSVFGSIFDTQGAARCLWEVCALNMKNSSLNMMNSALNMMNSVSTEVSCWRSMQQRSMGWTSLMCAWKTIDDFRLKNNRWSSIEKWFAIERWTTRCPRSWWIVLLKTKLVCN